MDMPDIIALDHVQLAMPANRETDTRAFYGGILGLPECPNPSVLAGRGGEWFERGALKLNPGVDTAFQPATKAHVAFLVAELASWRERLRQHDYPVVEDLPLPGWSRFYTADPFGNRIEIMQPHPA